jgi:hypothetical protein
MMLNVYTIRSYSSRTQHSAADALDDEVRCEWFGQMIHALGKI